MTQTIKAIIFDIDGTITDEVSWLYLTKEMGGDINQHKFIFKEFEDGRLEYLAAKKKVIELWEITGNNNLNYVKKIFSTLPFKKGVEDLVDNLKLKYKVCLITASMDILVDEVGRRLGISDCYANTKLIFENNKIVDFEYNLNNSMTKLEKFNEFANKYNLLPEEVAMVGNAENDLKIFENSGLSILVKNDINSDIESKVDYTVENLNEITRVLELN